MWSWRYTHKMTRSIEGASRLTLHIIDLANRRKGVQIGHEEEVIEELHGSSITTTPEVRLIGFIIDLVEMDSSLGLAIPISSAEGFLAERTCDQRS